MHSASPQLANSFQHPLNSFTNTPNTLFFSVFHTLVFLDKTLLLRHKKILWMFLFLKESYFYPLCATVSRWKRGWCNCITTDVMLILYAWIVGIVSHSDPIMTRDMATQQHTVRNHKGRPWRDFWAARLTVVWKCEVTGFLVSAYSTLVCGLLSTWGIFHCARRIWVWKG